MSELIIHTSDETFENDVVKSEKPVLLDFWAEWCSPCKAIAPVLADIAEEYKGRVIVAKINLDENQKTAPQFGVRSIPTLMLFKNGVVEAQSVGIVTKAELKAKLLDGKV